MGKVCFPEKCRVVNSDAGILGNAKHVSYNPVAVAVSRLHEPEQRIALNMHVRTMFPLLFPQELLGSSFEQPFIASLPS